MKAQGRATISTQSMIVIFNGTVNKQQASEWGKSNSHQLIRPLSTKNTYLFKCGIGITCLDQANTAYHSQEVRFSYPNWSFPVEKKTTDLLYQMILDTPISGI